VTAGTPTITSIFKAKIIREVKRAQRTLIIYSSLSEAFLEAPSTQ
jgi:hypothetical protein